MGMKNILPGCPAMRQEQVAPFAFYAAGGQAQCDLLRNLKQVPAHFRQQVIQTGRMKFGDHKHMPQVHGLDIHKSQADVVLVDFTGLSAACKDVAEDAIVNAHFLA